MRIKRVVVAAVVSLGLAGVAPVSPVSGNAGLEDSRSLAPQSFEPELVIDTANGVALAQSEIQAHYSLVASRGEARQGDDGFNYSRTSNVTNGQVSVVYVNADTPTAVKSAINAAVADWASVVTLHPNAPLEILVDWTDLQHPQVLGSAGASRYYLNGPWESSDWISAPLANVLAGYDYTTDGSDGSPLPEILMNINSEFQSWHLDHTTNPGVGEHDLYSVVLHEIGHGMGFAGSASDTNSDGSANLELTAEAPLTYDRRMSFGEVPILQAIDEGDPNAILTSGNLNFDLGAGRKYTTFAPDPFENGSSYSHFDEETYNVGSAGSLMTPRIAGGELLRQLDVPTLGVLAQIGWPMSVGVATPSIDGFSATWNENAAMGEIELFWSENLFQEAVPAHYYNVGAYRSGVLDASVDVAWSVTSALLTNIEPGSDYEIVLTPITPTTFGVPAKVDVRSANDPSDTEAPSVPGQPIIESQDDGRNATIVWAASSDNIGVDKYRVYESDNSLLDTVEETSARLSLDIGTHNIYVQAVDAAGNVSDASPQVQIVITSDPIQDIATHPDFTEDQADVLRLYWAFFNRDPDKSGAEYWIGVSNQGFSLDVIAEQFAVSQEFENTYGSTTNEEFLRIVYSNVLKRAADLSGFNYWMGQMTAGLSRGGVVRWIAANNEFVVQHPYPS